MRRALSSAFGQMVGGTNFKVGSVVLGLGLGLLWHLATYPSILPSTHPNYVLMNYYIPDSVLGARDLSRSINKSRLVQ